MARDMNSADTMRQIVTVRGEPDSVNRLFDDARRDLKADEPQQIDKRTPIEIQIDAAKTALSAHSAVALGGRNETTEMLKQRIEYLEAMKRAGRTSG